MRRKSCIDQTNSFFRLFVFCSFAPSPHEYTVSRGVPNPKNGENLMRLWFSRRVLKKSSVLGVHDFSGSAEKTKYRELSPFLRFDDNRQYHRQLLVILVYELANGFADYRL